MMSFSFPNNMNLEYKIERSSKRKRLTISVERDRSIIVNAPTSTSEEKIAAIVASKKAWIYAKVHHPQKYEKPPHPPGKELVNGESVLYLGRNYKVQLIDGNNVEFEQRFLIPKALGKSKKVVLKDWFIERAKEKILPRVSLTAKELGVAYGKASIVDNRFRWGSCTPNDNVSFNWRLIKAPMYVIDYIIVHELAHLLESNHTPRFWNIVRTRSTSAEKAKNWLREHGQILEEDI